MKEFFDLKRILKIIGVYVVWFRCLFSFKMVILCIICFDIFYVNFVLIDQKYIDEYWEQLCEFGRQGMFFDFLEKFQYYVYIIKVGGVCGYKFVVFSSNNIYFVMVELGFYNNDGKWYVKLVIKVFVVKNYFKLLFYGKVGKIGY